MERVLGAGGMGSVYLVRNVALDQLVALKVLHPDGGDDGIRHSRLIREARAAASIKSAHVVRVIDVVAEGPDAPFVVMEYLEGETLRSMLDRQTRLPLSEIMEIVSQVGEAIGEGHTLGIVHRDLKPENIFQVRKSTGGPLYKVLDFGISKLRREGAETLTSSRQVLASPAYAAPEQLRASRNADVPADVWSLGVVMYECLVGSRPFNGETLGHLCVQILEETPPPPSKLVPGLWPAVDEVVMRCLAKDPARRFSSMTELLSACVALAPAPCSRALAYLTGLASHVPLKNVQISVPASPVTPGAPASVASPVPTASAASNRSAVPGATPAIAGKSQTLTATELAAGASGAPRTPAAGARTKRAAAVLAVAAGAAALGAFVLNAARRHPATEPSIETSSASSLAPSSAAMTQQKPVAVLDSSSVPAAPAPPPSQPAPSQTHAQVPLPSIRDSHKKIPFTAPSAKNSAVTPAPAAPRWAESR